MAVKKIRMRPEGTNDYGDVLHPETDDSMVLCGDGSKTLATKIAEIDQAHATHKAEIALHRKITITNIEPTDPAELEEGEIVLVYE